MDGFLGPKQPAEEPAEQGHNTESHTTLPDGQRPEQSLHLFSYLTAALALTG